MDETYFAFYDKLEPFTDSELHALGITKQPVVIKEIDHEEVEETISQFEACVQEVLYLEPYKQTIHE